MRRIRRYLNNYSEIVATISQPRSVPCPLQWLVLKMCWSHNLPGLAMRHIANLHAGEAKTDARDAHIIAEAARSMPHTLRSLKLADDELAELAMLCGFDDGLAGQITQTSNRMRGLLTQIHPALERVLSSRLDHPAVLDLFERYPSPTQLAAASEKQLANRLVKLAPRMGKSSAAEIVQALSERTSKTIQPGLAKKRPHLVNT